MIVARIGRGQRTDFTSHLEKTPGPDKYRKKSQLSGTKNAFGRES